MNENDYAGTRLGSHVCIYATDVTTHAESNSATIASIPLSTSVVIVPCAKSTVSLVALKALHALPPTLTALSELAGVLQARAAAASLRLRALGRRHTCVGA